jgi:hypothetical protein
MYACKNSKPQNCLKPNWSRLKWVPSLMDTECANLEKVGREFANHVCRRKGQSSDRTTFHFMSRCCFRHAELRRETTASSTAPATNTRSRQDSPPERRAHPEDVLRASSPGPPGVLCQELAVPLQQGHRGPAVLLWPSLPTTTLWKQKSDFAPRVLGHSWSSIAQPDPNDLAKT